jgi:hypothetical protein
MDAQKFAALKTGRMKRFVLRPLSVRFSGLRVPSR